jgi:hypothetical protein
MPRWLNIALAVVILTAALAFIQLGLRDSLEEPGAIGSSAFSEATTKTEIHGRKVHSIKEQPFPEFEDQALYLWEILMEVPESAPIGRTDVPSRQLVSFDADVIQQLKEGSEIKIELSPIQSATVSISSVQILPSGNTSLLGKVNDNEWLDFVATIGEASSNATIGTEEGVFNLRGNRDYAWIAPGRAFNHTVDPSIPDYRLPKSMRDAQSGE